MKHSLVFTFIFLPSTGLSLDESQAWMGGQPWSWPQDFHPAKGGLAGLKMKAYVQDGWITAQGIAGNALPVDIMLVRGCSFYCEVRKKLFLENLYYPDTVP